MTRPCVQQFAAHYIGNMKWQVVPLAPHSKACKDNDWPRLVFKHADFRDDDNIGIRSVHNLVVLDLDCPEAVDMADAFILTTGAAYGRRSKPKSKRLFVCTGLAKTIAFK